MIKIQKGDFNIDFEIDRLRSKHSNIGAITTFVGYVREKNNNQKVSAIELQVYKQMALNSLEKISLKAQKKWKIIDSLIIHRFGKLKTNEKIVLVATFSSHRKESFEACKYIMDFLKKDAPFWKKEYYKDSFKWLKNTKSKNEPNQ
tara:strand:- start:193 stop:630 length:438 start_codon:yes stop_codon:yes gene_type:complete